MSRAAARRRAPALALLLGGSLLLTVLAAVGTGAAEPAAATPVAAPSGPPGTGPSACARTGGPDGRTAEPTGAAAAPAGAACPYEVWVSDQNNTAGFSPAAPRGTHGGRLLIYDGADLERGGGPRNAPEVIDLAERYAVGGPNNATGAPVVRPHMALPSPDHRYLALAFVASGHVAIIEGATRTPKALFRMSPGAAGVRQAHAAFWTVDGSAVLVANQNGKLLERIAYDPATDTFTHDNAATLDLAAHLWQFDRIANQVQVFDVRQDPPTHVGTVDLVTPGVSDDPTPDLIDIAPSGSVFLAALRGPRPQTGAHASAGTTPGLGIVTIGGDGVSGGLTHVLPTTFTNPIDGGEESDPHAAAVRLVTRGG